MISRTKALLIGQTVERKPTVLQSTVSEVWRVSSLSDMIVNPKRQQKKAATRLLGVKSGKTFNRLAKRARRGQRNVAN